MQVSPVRFGLYQDTLTDEELSHMKKLHKWFNNSPVRTSLLLEAHNLVVSKRAKEYGSFEENADTAAHIFNMLRRRHGSTGSSFITKEDVAWMQLCLKLAREASVHKRDNLKDAAGYLELIDELIEEQVPDENGSNAGNTQSS